MKTYVAFFVSFLLYVSVFAQPIPTPSEFLGYELGSTFTRHWQVVSYFKEVARLSDRVTVAAYGQTNEGRELMTAFVTAPSNHEQLETLRLNNLRAVGFEEGDITGPRLPIVWLSYNIHGNEASATEASMLTLYTLATQTDKDWLDKSVVIIDPCINPDGRDRYANFYRRTANHLPTFNRNSWEFQEPWPGGRANHYYFDLNRDWCWQSQVESRTRAKLYHQWMPQVHVDYHEMGYNEPYYFGPAAKPYHEVITDWQYTFQEYVGKNNAKYFEAENWLFFTRQVFDLFYPSYGDTWPIYQGAVGFTYEQGGSGRAGTGIVMQNGDTLTLKDRLMHHHTTGLSTIETSVKHGDELLSQFDRYFATARRGVDDTYAAYVVKRPQDGADAEAFRQLLRGNHIDLMVAKEASQATGAFSYQTQTPKTIQIEAGDWVIPTAQPQGHLLKVLFEPQSALEDSLTYDLTAWTIPYAYGFETYSVKSLVATKADEDSYETVLPEKDPYAVLIRWEGFGAAQFLGQALQKGCRVRQARRELAFEGETYPTGTLVITKADNPRLSLTKEILPLAGNLDLSFVTNGYSDNGVDMGSGAIALLKHPKVAIATEQGINAYSFGEMWHYFDRVLAYPFATLQVRQLNERTLADIDVLILPSGRYGEAAKGIQAFLNRGGRVIAIDRAIELFTTPGERGIRTQLGQAFADQVNPGKQPNDVDQPYASKERAEIVNYTAGSIYPVKLDPTHPLAYGMGDTFYSLKRTNKAYPYLPQGDNVGIIEVQAPLNGFTGHKLQLKIKDSLVLGSENVGRGKVIYFADSPITRGFWHSGKLLLANAVFLW